LCFLTHRKPINLPGLQLIRELPGTATQIQIRGERFKIPNDTRRDHEPRTIDHDTCVSLFRITTKVDDNKFDDTKDLFVDNISFFFGVVWSEKRETLKWWRITHCTKPLIRVPRGMKMGTIETHWRHFVFRG